jgi:hypothetical protein
MASVISDEHVLIWQGVIKTAQALSASGAKDLPGERALPKSTEPM